MQLYNMISTDVHFSQITFCFIVGSAAQTEKRYTLSHACISAAQSLWKMCIRSLAECATKCLQDDKCHGYEVEESCDGSGKQNMKTCSLLSGTETTEAPPGDTSKLYLATT